MYKQRPVTSGGSQALNNEILENFKGVDYSTAIQDVSLQRATEMKNIIPTLDGLPSKRFGYKLVKELENTINGIHELLDGETSIKIIHSGAKLYDWDSTEIVPENGTVADSRSVSFQKNNTLYILDGTTYWAYGKFGGANYKLERLQDVAYIPTTYTGRECNVGNAGGIAVDKLNFLSNQQINSFAYKSLLGSPKFYLSINGIPTNVKVERLNLNGTWTDISDYIDTIGNGYVEVLPFTQYKVVGLDSVRITFTDTSLDTTIINKCSIYDVLTYGVGDYFFLSGNIDHANFDYQSFVNDPTYFPVDRFANIGMSNSAIMTYAKVFNSQAIIKENNTSDYTIYLRTPQTTNGLISFTITQGIMGVGAISKYATANLRGEELYLSDEGINTIVTTDVTGEKSIQNRSYYINKKLQAESNLDKAIAIEYNGFYILAVNGVCYVADNTQKTYEKNSKTDGFNYEWYYWDNIPANTFMKNADGLYFGSTSGNIYQFCTNADTDPYLDDTTPVVAEWYTPLLYFKDISRYKTLKNFFIMIEPYLHSGVDVYYSVLSIDKLKMSKDFGLFDFSQLDFSKLDFSTDTTARVYSTKKKQKKFMTIQFLIKNENADPFAFNRIQLQYRYGGVYKR